MFTRINRWSPYKLKHMQWTGKKYPNALQQGVFSHLKIPKRLRIFLPFINCRKLFILISNESIKACSTGMSETNYCKFDHLVWIFISFLKASREIRILINFSTMMLTEGGIMGQNGQGFTDHTFVHNVECQPILYQVDHLSFDDYVTMDHNGKLKNGIQPAACICKKLNNFAYFLMATFFVCLFAFLTYFCSFRSVDTDS